MLRISFHDILRATLPLKSGNEGWIGVSPEGNDYHIVVPVDVQIARGVMACNRPTDGTPFGGYSDWLYFRCPPFDEPTVGPDEDSVLRRKKARQTAGELMRWLASYEIDAELVDEVGPVKQRFGSRPSQPKGGTEARFKGPGNEARLDAGDRAFRRCPGCGKTWETLARFLRDPDVRFLRYRICLENFQQGEFLFAHSCGSVAEIPVTRFARPRFPGRSLAGTHACPGLCYYESSDAPCSARCEGSLYRRVARRLKSC